MRNALSNLIGFEPQNLPMDVFVVCLLAWLLVLGATLWSIYSKDRRSLPAKIVWSIVVVGVPLGGVLVYALYSLTQVENMLLQGATPSKKKDNTAAKAGDEYADAVV